MEEKLLLYIVLLVYSDVFLINVRKSR
jgi:hypothetical protein